MAQTETDYNPELFTEKYTVLIYAVPSVFVIFIKHNREPIR